MKIHIDVKKHATVVAEALHKAGDAGKLAAAEVQRSAQALMEKSKEDNYLRKLKKYNPVFPEVYESSAFNIPNVIMIVDDAERRGIDVCEGAIGWLRNAGGLEIFCLYDEAVEMSGLRFWPTATCNAVYCVDSFDRKTFVQTDLIFKRAHEERIAELEHIAYSLGATYCSVQIIETQKEAEITNKKGSATEKATPYGVSTSENYEQDIARKESHQRSGKSITKFSGSQHPCQPTLKWFSNDEAMLRFIEMRLKNENTIKSKELRLSGATTATMSQKMACAIDLAVNKMGMEGSASMAAQVTHEMQSTLVYHVEF